MCRIPHPSPSISFPNEIHVEIGGHLDRHRDKMTLLQLALVNQFWRHQAQSILFRETPVGSWDRYLNGTAMTDAEVAQMHSQFLQAVINAPKRLGPYVHSYAQHVQAQLRQDPELLHSLQALTREALQHMVNLKHLTFTTPTSPSSLYLELFHNCTFQLQSFIWDSARYSDEYPTSFLSTQHSIQHLDISIGSNHGFEWLPLETRSELASTSSYYFGLEELADSRVTALDLRYSGPKNPPGHLSITQDEIVALRRLKHLRVRIYLLRHLCPEIVLPNLVLLEIQMEEEPLDVVQHLSPFPGLQVLALRALKYSDEEADDTCKKIVPMCFHHCQQLQRVVLHHRSYRSCAIFTMSQKDDGGASEVHREVTEGQFDFDSAWWIGYGMDM